jgi:hypothetical protein
MFWQLEVGGDTPSFFCILNIGFKKSPYVLVFRLYSSVYVLLFDLEDGGLMIGLVDPGSNKSFLQRAGYNSRHVGSSYERNKI